MGSIGENFDEWRVVDVDLYDMQGVRGLRYQEHWALNFSDLHHSIYPNLPSAYIFEETSTSTPISWPQLEVMICVGPKTLNYMSESGSVIEQKSHGHQA